MARMTIRDIARLAGVSVTTVSRALNNAPEINSQTRERVLQVCREQGYRSNLLARSLVSSRTRVLGVILPELSGPFHASIVLHLERYAQEQDYQIMLCCGRVGGSETAALFDFLVSHRVDGILLVSASSAAPDLLRRHARGTPSVLLGDVSPTATLQRINAVSTDNYVGGAMAAGYLSRLGHRRVLYLGPRRDSVTHVLRHQGFLTIAREPVSYTHLLHLQPHRGQPLPLAQQLGHLGAQVQVLLVHSLIIADVCVPGDGHHRLLLDLIDLCLLYTSSCR